MIFIKYVCRVPLRMSDEQLEIGDFAIHGEEPYTFEYYNRNYRKMHVGYTHDGKMTGTDDEEKLGGSGGDHSSNGHEGVLMGQDPHMGQTVGGSGVIGGDPTKDAIHKQD